MCCFGLKLPHKPGPGSASEVRLARQRQTKSHGDWLEPESMYHLSQGELDEWTNCNTQGAANETRDLTFRIWLFLPPASARQGCIKCFDCGQMTFKRTKKLNQKAPCAAPHNWLSFISHHPRGRLESGSGQVFSTDVF